MSHWSGVEGNEMNSHMSGSLILKDNVQKVILNTRIFWEFESATNELTNGIWPMKKY